MDILEYHKIIVMVAKENYFNLPYMDLKMQKKMDLILSLVYKAFLGRQCLKERRRWRPGQLPKGQQICISVVMRKI